MTEELMSLYTALKNIAPEIIEDVLTRGIILEWYSIILLSMFCLLLFSCSVLSWRIARRSLEENTRETVDSWEDAYLASCIVSSILFIPMFCSFVRSVANLLILYKAPYPYIIEQLKDMII